MKKKAPRRRSRAANGELRAEYDFRGGVRGKYAARYAAGTNVVVLDPDVARAFPDAASVNEALRALAPLVLRRKLSAAKPRRRA